MANKKTTRVFRTNLVNIGIGQGEMKTVPYLLSITELSPEGKTTSRSNFSSDGTLLERMEWVYDHQGQVTNEYYFAGEDEPSEAVRYERDGKGRITRDIKKYLDGSEDITTYQYDENNHLTVKLTIDDEGGVYTREIYNWDGDNLILHTLTDSENNIVEKDEFVYDNNGNILEHSRLNEETGENSRIVCKYNDANFRISENIYDGNNFLIESMLYNPGEDGRLLSSETKSIQKSSLTTYLYDERGNHLGQEETDQSGNQVLWVEHTYDEGNNLISSVVFMNGGMPNSSQHYELRYEYEWYDEDQQENE